MHQTIRPSMLEVIGDTPLVALDRIGAGLPGRVLLKLEYLNPGASMKDRIALRIIEDAEKAGKLRPGGTIVELTSGNTGTGLAVVCAIKGYRLIAVMSEGNSPERRKMLRALGATVELVPQSPGSRHGQVTGDDLALVDRRTTELTRELGAFRADQFGNPSNALAHELTTAQEIWLATDGQVSAFVAMVGTGGTFIGASRGLKAKNPALRCYAVEPEKAQFLATGAVENPAHKLQGAGYSLRPPQWEDALCDGFLAVSDEEAIAVSRQLAQKEAVLGGFSTGANVAAALRLARNAKPGEQIVTLASDSAMKYLSTDLFE